MDCRVGLLGYQRRILRSGNSRTLQYLQLMRLASGGDDLKMKGWDIRQGGVQPTFANERYVMYIRRRPLLLVLLGLHSDSMRESRRFRAILTSNTFLPSEATTTLSGSSTLESYQCR